MYLKETTNAFSKPDADVDKEPTNVEYTSKFQTDFEMLDVLGDGAYGVVLKVKKNGTDDYYAIKRVLAAESREKMEREIKIKDCKHQNIVKYYDSWFEEPPPSWQENEDKKFMKKFNYAHIDLSWSTSSSNVTNPSQILYIQMEMCKKETLADWLRKNLNDRSTEIHEILEQIVSAAEYIHLQDLIHRDLKVIRENLINFKDIFLNYISF